MSDSGASSLPGLPGTQAGDAQTQATADDAQTPGTAAAGLGSTHGTPALSTPASAAGASQDEGEGEELFDEEGGRQVFEHADYRRIGEPHPRAPSRPAASPPPPPAPSGVWGGNDRCQEREKGEEPPLTSPPTPPPPAAA